MLNMARNVGRSNPESAHVQSKCLYYFIRGNKPDLALDMAENLAIHCAKHPKTSKAIESFVKYSEN